MLHLVPPSPGSPLPSRRCSGRKTDSFKFSVPEQQTSGQSIIVTTTLQSVKPYKAGRIEQYTSNTTEDDLKRERRQSPSGTTLRQEDKITLVLFQRRKEANFTVTVLQKRRLCSGSLSPSSQSLLKILLKQPSHYNKFHPRTKNLPSRLGELLKELKPFKAPGSDGIPNTCLLYTSPSPRD